MFLIFIQVLDDKHMHAVYTVRNEFVKVVSILLIFCHAVTKTRKG